MKKRNHEKRNHLFQNKKEIMKISLSPYVFQMNPVKTLPESIDLKPDWVHYLTGYIAENLWGKKNTTDFVGSPPSHSAQELWENKRKVSQTQKMKTQTLNFL